MHQLYRHTHTISTPFSTRPASGFHTSPRQSSHRKPIHQRHCPHPQPHTRHEFRAHTAPHTTTQPPQTPTPIQPPQTHAHTAPQTHTPTQPHRRTRPHSLHKHTPTQPPTRRRPPTTLTTHSTQTLTPTHSTPSRPPPVSCPHTSTGRVPSSTGHTPAGRRDPNRSCEQGQENPR